MPDSPCVLVVDDDKLDRAVACLGLSEMGFSVAETGSGPETLSLISSGRKFDALFTDIFLGGGADGWDVALAFEKACPGAPVIYASGIAPDEPRRVAGSLFFPKPYDPSKVALALKALLPAKLAGPAVPTLLCPEEAYRTGPRLSRLVYVSRPTKLAFAPTWEQTVALISQQSAILNAEAGLTGALFADRSWFVQVLEGTHAALYATLARITNDPRHEDIRIHEIATAPARLFGRWSMHVSDFEGLSPALHAACIDSFARPSPASAQTIISAMVTSTLSTLKAAAT